MENLIKNAIEKLSEDQIKSLEKLGKKFKNPNSINPQEAKKIIEDLGIDFKSMIPKKEKQIKTQKPNELCDCGSEKKYKKCCRLKK